MDPLPENVAAARRFVVDSLTGAHHGVDDCELLVSELATNAVRHGRSMFRVGVYRRNGPVRIEVSDHNARLPVEGGATADAQSGRGLQIVDALSLRWGVRPESEGKTVWFEVGL
jgi:anti-sigma regulatory factor (Ser/Thr protein kinase)